MKINKFSLPWRRDSYRAALGHEVNRVVSFHGEQIFQGSLDDCNLIVLASSMDADKIREQVESKWSGALEFCQNRAESARKNFIEEIGALSQQCYSYQEKIRELGGDPFSK